jgi:heptosyltransferase-2
MPKAFILIRFSSLGDLVLTTALVKKIHDEYPDSPLYFLTKDRFSEFVSQNFPHSKIHCLNLPKGFLSLINMSRDFINQLSQNKPSELIILDLQGSFKSNLVCRLINYFSKLKSIKTLTKKSPKYNFKRSLSVLLHKDLLPKRKVYLEHLALLPQSKHYSPTLKVSQKRKAPLKILLAPDAQHWKKRWPNENWLRLIEMLKEEKIEMTLVGDRKLFSDKLNLNSEEKYIHNLLGKTKLSELTKIAAEHHLCVCSNSAWLHISEATGTPVLSLAGPIPPGFGFSPWKSESRELSENLFCKPCSKHGQGFCFRLGKNHHRCMKAFTPEILFYEIKEILKKC